MQTGKDLKLRTIPCRLVCEVPNPESRDPALFKHRRLDRFVRENRPRLVVAALTVLLSYHAAGRPGGLDSLRDVMRSNYDSWGSLIRGALVWLGQADPYAGTKDFFAVADGQDAPIIAALAELHRAGCVGP